MINSWVHLSKKHNLKMIKCQKHLFNLDHTEYYLNCAYKSPLLKKGELLAINAIKNLAFLSLILLLQINTH